jgi:hypothetical protein
MSDQERELTPEQEAEVGRLLADARATEPMPADVAARLDRVLVGLGEERAWSGRPPPGGAVAELAARRRRRVNSLLVAAAAVVAVGIGVGQLVGDRDAADSGTSAESGGDGGDLAVTEESPPDEAGAQTQDAAPEADGPTSSPPANATVGRVAESRFVADVNQLRRALPDLAVQGEFVTLNRKQLPSDLSVRERSFTCSAASWGPGALVPILYDGKPAVLAFREATGDSQVVEVLQCGTADILHAATLPAG